MADLLRPPLRYGARSCPSPFGRFGHARVGGRYKAGVPNAGRRQIEPTARLRVAVTLAAIRRNMKLITITATIQILILAFVGLYIFNPKTHEVIIKIKFDDNLLNNNKDLIIPQKSIDELSQNIRKIKNYL